jgi:hypothetical protein
MKAALRLTVAQILLLVTLCCWGVTAVLFRWTHQLWDFCREEVDNDEDMDLYAPETSWTLRGVRMSLLDRRK